MMRRSGVKTVLLFVLLVVHSDADDIDLEVHSGVMMKMLREMANKTNATDSLNLPANASSIRENITDTFSCENRTYGYYADVDNECQLFHVCVPVQLTTGRNVTYRYSFICPNETIFNQEVLVCTRPIDSIPCEESPMYYDLNMEIGKVPPKNNTRTISKKNEETPKETKNRRRPDQRKQNIVLGEIFKDFVDEEINYKVENIEFGDNEEIFPEIVDDASESNVRADDDKEEFEIEENISRLALERTIQDRNLKKGSFRFSADV